jgi:hypothetical protein
VITRRIFRALQLAAVGALVWGGALGSVAQAQVSTLEPTYTSVIYKGSVDNSSSCARNYNAQVTVPGEGRGGYPLFIYLHGANASLNEFTTRAPSAVTKAMAQRGFVAASAQYDSSLAAFWTNRKNVMNCLFSSAVPEGLLTKLCALDHVDCNQGIVLWGHSFGAMLTLAAYNVEPRVRGVWATGVNTLTDPSGVTSRLSTSRIRIVNGMSDTVPIIGGLLVANNNSVSKLNSVLGLAPAKDCPGQANQCLRPDGSGWMLVQTADMSPAFAPVKPDHCWFESKGCNSPGYYSYDDYFFDAKDASGNYASRIAIGRQADWLAKVARTAQ